MPVPFAMYVQAAGHLQPALAALEAGRLTEARVLLERAVQERPREGAAWASLARIYAALSLSANASAAAIRAERLSKDSPDTQHALALYYAQSGNRRRAAELERLYAASPQADQAAPARAALLSAEVHQWPEAIQFGRKALASGQSADLLLPMLIRAYEATGKTDDALDMGRRLADASPYSEDAQTGYGIALLRAGRFTAAAQYLERTRLDFDKSPQIELALGTAYYAQRRFAEAGARFFRVIELDPGVHQPYIYLARMIDQIPEQAAAFVARSKFWYESGTRHPFAPYVYAKALAASGASQEAVRTLLEEALGRDAKVWEFHFELAQFFERERDYRAAARSYEKSVACASERPEPHYRLSRIYDRLGRSVEAARERKIHAALTGKEQSRAGSMEP